MNNSPNLTFFCEMPAEALQKLFADGSLIKQLRRLNANISLGLLDLSNERAEVVNKLNHAGIPVTAWLLLPKDQGYWTSLDTVKASVRCYSEFKTWTTKHKLNWAAIGLDIEPRLDRINLLSSRWPKEIPNLLRRMASKRKFEKLENDLRTLVSIIRSDGYAVETYNFPFVVEERKAHSHILSRTLGTPPLDADREVLMLYSSFFAKNGDAVLWSYAHQAKGIGLGSTGGGVDIESEGQLKSMRWIDLRRDLLIAKEFTPHIYIFSLEGCVANGYLDRLESFDWNGMVQIPVENGKKVIMARKGLQSVLWLLSHPCEVIGVVVFWTWLVKKYSKK